MIERVLVMVLTNLTSWLFAKGIEKMHQKQVQAGTEKDIDERLAKFKAAYTEAFDGNPLTPEQKKKLRDAAADFIRGGNGGL